MITKGLFTSLRGDWKTPKELYEELNKEFNFDFDPCPNNPNFNGLECEWGGANFVNPPYGGVIKLWIEKAFNEALKGKVVVLLIPSRTDTSYWHRFILPYNINLPRDEEIIWASGLIDGEGCVFIKKDKVSEKSRNRSPVHSIGIKVAMTDKKAIYKLKEIFKRGHIIIPKKFDGIKQPYIWTCRSNDASFVANKIYPFSITKKKELFKILEFSTWKTARMGRKRIEPRILEKREEAYLELRKLKNPDYEIPIIETEIRFIKGRLCFDDSGKPAPFPSAVVVFKNGNK